jgi:hypothetical protein
MLAGDYRRFRSENAENRSLETDDEFAIARSWRPFCDCQGRIRTLRWRIGTTYRVAHLFNLEIRRSRLSERSGRTTFR